MQRVSAAYKQEQNEYLRQENYIWVYLGVISKEAQAYAKPNGTFAPYSSEVKSTTTEEFEAYYATPEENMARVDGSQYFVPRSRTFALYQGAVTQDLLAPITYTFEPYTSLDIKGLTIDFGDYYPTRFRVDNGIATYTYEYENEAAGVWTCEDIFRNTSHITITPLEMKGGQQRLRILHITFGVGLFFDNTSLISTSWKSSCSHISDVLPTKSFTFTISNLNKKFAADDPHSFVSFLQEQQEVSFNYGRKLLDGTIYTINGGKMFLKSWSSDDTQAKFNCVGFMDYLSGTYYKGRFYENGISLYDLMVDVIEDAGIEEYVIDNYLKTLYTHNPLPIQKHKNLIQLIANAGRCIIRETRDGKLECQSSFEPDIISVTSNGIENYCVIGNLFDDNIAANDYASAERNFTCVDAHQFFRPRNNSHGVIEASYTSSHVSKANGEFVTNPTITIQWESSWTFFNLKIEFEDVKPKRLKVYSYHYGTLVETLEVTEIDLYTIIQNSFYDVDKIVIEFTETNPYQKIHIGKIRFGNVTDYTLDYTDMSTSPNATTSDFIKDVTVTYYEYAYGTSSKKLSTSKSVVGQNTVTFSKPCHSYSLAYKDGVAGTLSIIDSGAYFITFSSSRTAEVDITGTEFVVSEKTRSTNVHQIGTDKTSKNVIIDNAEMAEDNCEWLADYFANDIDYKISYRGEPALDPDDQIFTENKYVERNLVRIVDTQINTSTGMSMSCVINGRRTHYVEPAIVDVAIVDESELP